ncbi:MAG TPA: hypothetical protein VGN37_16325 [Actinocatenispora sp.]
MSQDEELSRALHALADEDDGVPAPVDDLVRRGHVAARRRTAALSVAAVGAVAAVGVVTAIAASGPTAPPRQQAQPDPAVRGSDRGPTDAARTRLVAVVRTSGGDSFRFDTHGTNRHTAPGRSTTPQGFGCTGAIDPAQPVGYYQLPNGEETRIVGDDAYVYEGGKWFQETDPTFSHRIGCGRVALSASPSDILDPIRNTGTVRYLGRRGSGADAVDVYGVAYVRQLEGPNTVQVTATVRVGVRSQRVAEVDESSVYRWKQRTDSTSESVTTYSGYGEPVTVERPTVGP